MRAQLSDEDEPAVPDRLWAGLTDHERLQVAAAFAADRHVKDDAERLLRQLSLPLRRVFAAEFARKVAGPTYAARPVRALMPALSATITTARADSHDPGKGEA